jgi:hypothetical protein
MPQTNVNHWDLKHPTGEGFLHHLRDSSRARVFCREVIQQLIEGGAARSILEIGIGGCNEIIALDPFLREWPDVRYSGTDWTPKFIEEAREHFPRYNWQRLDITQCEIEDHLASDIVYSQHVLEHCGGLNPALSNMLQFANKMLLNIFFLPPQETEEIHFKTYPYYENRYSIEHIHLICKYHGFESKLMHCNNSGLPAADVCGGEVVLVAVRPEAGINVQ